MSKDSLLNIILNIVKQGSGDKDAKDGMADLEGQLGSTITSLAEGVLGFASLSGAAYAAAAALEADVSAAADDQMSLARLNATIESTGRVGEVSAASLDKMAASPLFTTGEIDQAANALMRFVDIPSQQLGPDLIIVENLAAGLGETLPAAAQTLGMALETGRVRGLGFSKELTTEISLLMTQGEAAQADAIILDQLSQKYSGQAAAALDTYQGAQQRLKASQEEYNASIGGGFLGGLQAIDNTMADLYDRQTKLNSGQEVAVQQTSRYGSAMVTLNGQAGELVEILARENGLQDVANTELDDYNGKMGSAAKATAIMTQAEKDLQKTVADKTSWEQMYTSAKTAADQSSQVMKLLGSDIEGIGADGADVWNGFLAATGQISPAAEKQFVQIQNDYQTVKKMLADGISVDIVVRWLEIQTWADSQNQGISPPPQPPPPPKTTNKWNEGKPQAEGGDYIVNGPTTFLAGEAGPERATFTPLNGSGGSAGGGTEIHVHYHAPMVSMSDEARLKERLGPIIDQLIQKYKGRL